MAGADVVIDSDVPIGSGLSSSAALTCAVALAVNELTGAGLDRMQLVQACQQAESDGAAAPTGIMDQVAALFAEPGCLVHLDVRTREVTPVALQLDGLELVVIDTKSQHSNAGAGYAARRRECEEAAALLGVASLREVDVAQPAGLAARPGHDGLLGRRARHVFTENARVTRGVALARAGRVADIGPLLTASHASLCDDFEASSPELDVAVNAALEAGALGARMTGGGFGGSVIALLRGDGAGEMREAVQHAFARLDWTAPDVFPVAPASGARRLR